MTEKMFGALPRESIFSGLKNRIFQALARHAPGVTSLRVWLHRWRGVRIGTGVHIGTDALIETGYPSWISIGNGVQIGIRTTIIAHFHGLVPKEHTDKEYISVRIEDEVYIGAGVIILPNVTIGHGSVITAGSVISRSVPPLSMVQGNPARTVARCGIPLTFETPLKEFYRNLRPLKRSDPNRVIEKPHGCRSE